MSIRQIAAAFIFLGVFLGFSPRAFAQSEREMGAEREIGAEREVGAPREVEPQSETGAQGEARAGGEARGEAKGDRKSAPKEEEFSIKNFDLQKGRIVFAYTLDAKNSDIYVLDLTDLSVTPIVTTPAIDDNPVWSPDGKKIVFHSDATGDREIYVVKEDGTDLTQLTNSPEADENPSWSPDGKSIVFQSRRRKNGADIYVMDANGSNQRAIVANGQRNVCPSWSPRKDEIVFSSDEVWPGWVLKIYSFSAGKSQTLTKGTGSFVRPNWYPDGGAIVFSYGNTEHLDIFRADKGRALAVQLIAREGRNFDPSWDDTGRYLFFAGELTPGKEDYQLFFSDMLPSAVNKNPEKHLVQLLQSKGAVRHPNYTPLPSLATLQKVRK